MAAEPSGGKQAPAAPQTRGSLRGTVLALSAAMVLTVVAWAQLRADQRAEGWSSLGWFLRPVVLSPEAALAHIDCNLRAVTAADRNHVFIVGDRGLISPT